MNRVVIAGALLLFSALLAAVSFVVPSDMRASDLLLNLGSEIMGIALTVAVIDWLIERKKTHEEALRVAWSMLHDIDHAVFVWQGGRREFHLDEMVALLDLVTDRDPIERTTRDLMAQLGMKASDLLRLQNNLVKAHPKLGVPIRSLASLGQIRELSSLATPTYICDALRSSIRSLAEFTEQEIHEGSFGMAKKLRDPSAEAQYQRFTGVDTAVPRHVLEAPSTITSQPGSSGV